MSFSPSRPSIHRAISSLLWCRKSIRFCGFSATGSPLAISAHRCPYSSLPRYTPCRNSFNGLSLLLKYASCSRQNFFLCLRPSKALLPLSATPAQLFIGICPCAAPQELLSRLCRSNPHWIAMDIITHCCEVAFILYKKAFEPTLKQMPAALMPPVIPAGIRYPQPLYCPG